MTTERLAARDPNKLITNLTTLAFPVPPPPCTTTLKGRFSLLLRVVIVQSHTREMGRDRCQKQWSWASVSCFCKHIQAANEKLPQLETRNKVSAIGDWCIFLV